MTLNGAAQGVENTPRRRLFDAGRWYQAQRWYLKDESR